MMYSKFQKYVNISDAPRIKKQYLKQKNILHEDDKLQIGCKINQMYDFYTSSNYIQINLFIGNKSQRPLQSFSINFKATNNIKIYVQQKQRFIKQRTQYKQRIIVQCLNYQEQVLVLFDFKSIYLTLLQVPFPITLLNFFTFKQRQNLPKEINNQTQLQKLLQKTNEYTQERQIILSNSFLKKNIGQQIDKYLTNLNKICQGVYIGNFNIKSLIDDYTIVFKFQEKQCKISLSSNEYELFDNIFDNLNFILA